MTTNPEVVFDSLPPEQQEAALASPMSQQELNRLAALEEEMKAACLKQLRAELNQGEALAELKDHPRLLWQRDPMFRTKSGGWHKRRSWDRYVVNHNLAESGKEADRLIAQWKQREVFRAIDS